MYFEDKLQYDKNLGFGIANMDCLINLIGGNCEVKKPRCGR